MFSREGLLAGITFIQKILCSTSWLSSLEQSPLGSLFVTAIQKNVHMYMMIIVSTRPTET